MTNEQPTNEKDSALWELAKKRAGFKKSLATYIIVNSFLWILWYFTNDNNYNLNQSQLPWPVWPMLGWGIGLAFQYVGAYVSPNTISVENEYQKLKNK
jgi:2TM domain